MITETIERFVGTLFAGRDAFRMYAHTHPNCIDLLDKLLELLGTIFSEHTEIAIGIVGNEFVWKDEVFFSLSERLQLPIKDLLSREIERMVFRAGITRDELSSFMLFLLKRTGDVDAMASQAEQYFRTNAITHISVGKINVGDERVSSVASEKKSDSVMVSRSFVSLYEHSVDVVSGSVDSILEGEILDPALLKGTISQVMETLIERYQELLTISTVKRYDVATFRHIMGVAVLAMHFAKNQGFSEEDVLGIGIAGLFHDMGKLYISRKIIGKKGALSEEEFTAIQSHTVLGAELLLRYVDSLGYFPVLAAFEHHIKYDLSGYPKVPPSYKPHLVSRIIALCDVYDALTQRRSYKKDYPPDMVFHIMQKGRGVQFDPDLFDAFFTLIGVWPVGTIVVLNDTSIAIVREATTDMYAPIVELVDPVPDKNLLNLSESDNRLTIQKSLNPFAEGKPYVAMI